MTPKYSICILNHNKLKLLERCVLSVIKYIDQKKSEIILIDNGSTDGSKEWMKRISGQIANMKIIPLDKNYGVMIARNKGFDAASGEFILSFDNDTVWTGDVISNLEKTISIDSSIGIVGMCGIYIPVINRYFHIHNNCIQKPLEVTSTTGYCMMIRSKLISEGIKYDEKFIVTQGDDIDLCLQAKKKKYKIFMSPGVPLIHHEHGSISFYKDRYYEIMKNNYRLIKSKWGEEFSTISDCSYENILKLLEQGNDLRFTLEIDEFRYYDFIRCCKARVK